MKRLPNGSKVNHMWLVKVHPDPQRPAALALRYAVVDLEQDLEPMPYLEAERKISDDKLEGKVTQYILSYIGLN